jgi:hypothetical protein
MDISIARAAHRRIDASARDDERQPRFWELQLGGMNGIHPHHPLLTLSARRRGRLSTPREFESSLPEEVTSFDLRAAPPIGEAADTSVARGAGGRAIHLQHREPHGVHGLERQRILKARLGRRLEPRGVLQGAHTLQTRPVTLETQETAGSRATDPTVPFLQRLAAETAAAAGTEGSRRDTFQLPAWESKPFRVSSLQDFVYRCPHGIAV